MLKYFPGVGAIVICDFSGLEKPEMTKRRLAIVVSPKLNYREGLCTIVPCSTSEPRWKKNYHCQIKLDPPLPPPYDSPDQWVKSDMIYTMALHRLDVPHLKDRQTGQRVRDVRFVTDEELATIRSCVRNGVGF